MTATSEAPATFRSSAVRPKAIGLIREALTEVLGRRRLIRYLVQADVKKKGANTLLGNIWWVVDPLLQMAVYVLLISVIFRRGGVDYPLFLFSAILPWKWFVSSVGDGLSSIVSSERLIKQIQFPKLVLPVASVMSGIVNFAFGLIPLAALIILFYGHRATPWLVLIPVVAAVQLLFTLPVAIVLGAVNVFYRDLGNLMRHVLRLWFYLSPGLFALESLKGVESAPRWVVDILLANPFATLFTAYRALIYDGQAPEASSLIVLATVSLVLLTVSIILFKRLEPSFAKVL
ncbi:MAG TPA: ABC transporter permease [Candidatus Limnocylindrales bacterium]|jgi:ABC-type polysaccharide/polyol phosphate export permease